MIYECDIQVKEREEKLEYWKKRSKAIEDKKKEKNELIRKKSSEWVDEAKLHAAGVDAYVAGKNNGFRY